MSDKLETIANGSSYAQSSAKSLTARDDIAKVLTERIETIKTVAPNAAEQPLKRTTSTCKGFSMKFETKVASWKLLTRCQTKRNPLKRELDLQL
ncbi:unnamed protein product [Heligmosomoides polygyrus]|uniref:Uncharacterized protein n=1 Tax=Heligmosomoides polygyrus TaxID=6339 RepID=A0A183G807_HELPZ|nr:unnamed protein product [Heligmosomoides polygyrus]